MNIWKIDNWKNYYKEHLAEAAYGFIMKKILIVRSGVL